MKLALRMWNRIIRSQREAPLNAGGIRSLISGILVEKLSEMIIVYGRDNQITQKKAYSVCSSGLGFEMIGQ